MKNNLYPLLFITLFATFIGRESFGQCSMQDTTHKHHASINLPCGLAYSNGRIVVTSYNPDTFGAPATVQIWNDHYEFTDLFPANDSFTLIAPEAAAFDASGNLYIVQTERSDSNIMIYDTGLHLIKVIDNTPGIAAHWNNPRGIAFDSAQNLYIISQDSTEPAPRRVDIPNTGKLIKITAPLGAATKSVLLSGLNDPKAVAINSRNIYVSEYGNNKVTRYDLYTMSTIDFINITKPMDLFTTGCILYCTEQETNTVKVINAINLPEGADATITGFSGQNSPSGIILDDAYNLFISDTNRVVFYNAIEHGRNYVLDTSITDTIPIYCIYSYFSFHDSIPPLGVFHEWKSSDTLVATVDSVGNIHAIARGGDTIIQIIGVDTMTYNIIISDCGYLLCLHSPGLLPSYFPPDTLVVTNKWFSSDSNIVRVDTSGIIYGSNVGETAVHHIVNADTMNFSVTVEPITGPLVAPIYMRTDTINKYFSDIFCISSVIQLFEDSTNGYWSISDASIADVDVDGSVWPFDTGTALVYYTTTVSGCYSDSQSFQITIVGPPSIDAIPAKDTICRGDIIMLSDSTAGGTWSSSSTSIATITSSGVINGIAYGSTNIAYSLSNSCGPSYVYKTIHVDTATYSGNITGDTSVCKGSTINLSDSVSGGTWSSNNSNDSITKSGTLTGAETGIVTISYSVTCATTVANYTVTVNALPDTAVISGGNTVCAEDSIQLTASAGGGTWSCSNSYASISSGGVVTGNAAGTDTISYIISTPSCGSDTAIAIITVKAKPQVGLIRGPDSLCVNSTVTLTDTAALGTWSVSNTYATIADGVVTSGANPGTDAISYIVSNTCGADTAIYNITIDNYPNAGIVYNPYNETDSTAIDYSQFCIYGYQTFYSSGDTGGAWSIADPTIAYADEYGNVFPVGTGTTTLTYTIANACGSGSSSLEIVIDAAISASTIYGPSEFCISDNPTFDDYGGYGSIYSWSVSDPSVAYIDPVYGNLHPITGGNITVYYTEFNSCQNNTDSLSITIDSIPYAGTISGTTTVCAGTSVVLTDPVSGGVWVGNNTNATVSGSLVSGVSAGSDDIYYIVTNSCGSDTALHNVTVNALPNAGTITGLNTVCATASINLTDLAIGGTWSADNTNASVTGGTVTGVTAGNDSIFYTVTNACGTAHARMNVVIDQVPNAGTIYGGSSEFCISDYSQTFYDDGDIGGTWSIDDPTIAAIDEYGDVSPIGPGTTNVIYTVTNGCGTTSAYFTITIDPYPYAGIIEGPTEFCISTNPTYNIDFGDGLSGTWSVSNPSVAYIDPVYSTLSAYASDTLTVFYTESNTCGPAVAFLEITIDATPNAASISGADTMCAGTNITLTDAATGGTWASDNSNATVTDGVVSGITTGTVNIVYIVTNTCGADSAIQNINIITIPAIPADITGATTVCQDATTLLSESTTGGTWTLSNNNATIIDSAVSGATAGTDTVIYTVSNSCGSASNSHFITINPLPDAGIIIGTNSVCQGDSITLSDTITGGLWASINVNASVSDGVVAALTAGSDTILYMVSNSCGTDSVIQEITINTLPNTGTITGPSIVCTGTYISLNDTIAGGTWSITNANALLSADTIRGITPGNDTVIYRLTNVCGTDSAAHYIVIDSLPSAGTITGAATVCQGDSILLADITTGGIWTSSNTHATISSLGITCYINGITQGTDTIYYKLTNTCGTDSATHTVAINTLPNTGIITGLDSLCTGASIDLSDSITGGTWLSSNAHATVSAIMPGSTITGIIPGNDTIIYRLTNMCGSDSAIHIVNIVPMPNAGTIVGRDSLCVGANITLNDSVTSGTWLSSNADANVTITSTESTISGISAGTDTIIYEISNLCGTNAAYHTIRINPLPDAGIITGATAVCEGNQVLLNDTNSGGTWTTSNANATLTISTSGSIVMGITPGIDTIIYSVNNLCGTDSALDILTINISPNVGVIEGVNNICMGSTGAFSNISPGGNWSSSNTTIATINTMGILTGITTGTTTISYSYSNICGSSDTAKVIIVAPNPIADITTSGFTEACSNTLYQNFGTDLPPVGTFYTWSATNASIYAVGADSQYCLVCFPAAGISVVKLTAEFSASGCRSADSFTVNVGLDYSPAPANVIFYGTNELICMDNTANSYQWGYDNKVTLDSSIIEGANNQDYFADTLDFTNNFYWVLTEHGGCLQKSYYNGPVSVNNIKNNNPEIFLFPNPANDKINIEIKNISYSATTGISLFDMSGNKIYKTNIYNGAATVDISQLLSGVYLVMFSDNDIILGTKTFVKE